MKDKRQTEIEEEAEGTSGKRNARKALLVVGVICLLVAIGAISYVLVSQWQLQQAQDRLQTTGTATAVQEDLVDNPVDFAELKQQNDEVYSYIYVPGTNVNYPILQSATDDNYYLTRNIDCAISIEGALYTQSCNSLDYHDPVTVIYGHNIHTPEMMFHQLHSFQDATFFAEHDTFYIYTQQLVLTYQIVAAYEYDNRHIINSFDFSNPEVVQSYFDSVLNPSSLVSNVREGATLTSSDKIVQLSTCVTSGAASSRYIVTGKLINEQKTR